MGTVKTKNSKIANIQFILTLMVVFIHSSCLFISLPEQGFMQVYGVNAASFIQLFIGEGICRIAVPMFFIISGYLFYKSFDGSLNSYKNKLKRRVSSLVIPYLFWSTVVFFAFFLVQKIFGLSLMSAAEDIQKLTPKILFDNIILDSMDVTLWYCRYLIVFSLLSIILYFPYKKTPVIAVIVSACIWLLNGEIADIKTSVKTYSVFFYTLGAVIALHEDFFKKLFSSIKKPAVIVIDILFVISLSVRTAVFMYQDSGYLLDGAPNRFLKFSGALCIILGIAGLWFTYDYFAKDRIWSLSKYSFMIFAAHHPVLNMVKKLMLMITGYNQLTSVIVFFLSAAVTIALILGVSRIIRKYIPPLWKIATGNR